MQEQQHVSCFVPVKISWLLYNKLCKYWIPLISAHLCYVTPVGNVHPTPHTTVTDCHDIYFRVVLQIGLPFVPLWSAERQGTN